MSLFAAQLYICVYVQAVWIRSDSDLLLNSIYVCMYKRFESEVTVIWSSTLYMCVCTSGLNQKWQWFAAQLYICVYVQAVWIRSDSDLKLNSIYVCMYKRFESEVTVICCSTLYMCVCTSGLNQKWQWFAAQLYICVYVQAVWIRSDSDLKLNSIYVCMYKRFESEVTVICCSTLYMCVCTSGLNQKWQWFAAQLYICVYVQAVWIRSDSDLLLNSIYVCTYKRFKSEVTVICCSTLYMCVRTSGLNQKWQWFAAQLYICVYVQAVWIRSDSDLMLNSIYVCTYKRFKSEVTVIWSSTLYMCVCTSGLNQKWQWFEAQLYICVYVQAVWIRSDSDLMLNSIYVCTYKRFESEVTVIWCSTLYMCVRTSGLNQKWQWFEAQLYICVYVQAVWIRSDSDLLLNSIYVCTYKRFESEVTVIYCSTLYMCVCTSGLNPKWQWFAAQLYICVYVQAVWIRSDSDLLLNSIYVCMYKRFKSEVTVIWSSTLYMCVCTSGLNQKWQWFAAKLYICVYVQAVWIRSDSDLLLNSIYVCMYKRFKSEVTVIWSSTLYMCVCTSGLNQKWQWFAAQLYIRVYVQAV